MANSLQRHKTADAVKWFIVFVLLLGVIASVVTLFIQVDRNTTVTQIGAEAYKIAALDDSGEETEYSGETFAAGRYRMRITTSNGADHTETMVRDFEVK